MHAPLQGSWRRPQPRPATAPLLLPTCSEGRFMPAGSPGYSESAAPPLPPLPPLPSVRRRLLALMAGANCPVAVRATAAAPAYAWADTAATECRLVPRCTQARGPSTVHVSLWLTDAEAVRPGRLCPSSTPCPCDSLQQQAGKGEPARRSRCPVPLTPACGLYGSSSSGGCASSQSRLYFWRTVPEASFSLARYRLCSWPAARGKERQGRHRRQARLKLALCCRRGGGGASRTSGEQ